MTALTRNEYLERILAAYVAGGGGGIVRVEGVNVDNSDPFIPIVNKVLHFGAYSLDGQLISIDPDAPTYLTGIALAGSSSPEFALITAPDGSILIKNNSGRAFPMQGSATYQITQGAGGKAEFKLWSETSSDDGVTFVENEFSLRTSDVPNNAESSQTKTAAVGNWLPGQSIRWAMYNAGPGDITLQAPQATVNGGNVVEGFSFFWQLNEV